MKNFKKLTAFILALATVVSACVFGVSAQEEEITEPQTLAEYKEMLDEQGYPAMSTEQFMNIMRKGFGVYRKLTFREDEPVEHFNFVTDELIQELCGYIADETGLDLLLMTSNMPESNNYVAFVMDTFEIDTVALREILFEIKDEKYAEGNNLLGKIFYFFGVYLSIIEKCEAYFVPAPELGKDCYEIYLRITMRDGATEEKETGIILDTATGEIFDRHGNGIVGTGYNFSTSEMLVYTLPNMWVRNFGFCFLYDLFSYTTPFFFYETRRIKFDYEGKDWMVQIWKGNYLVSNGAEVGVYNRDRLRFGTYYDCVSDEDMLEMSMALRHGDELIFERENQKHWWLTGFKIDDTLYASDTMTLDFTITMKDAEMLEAFCKSIDRHYKKDMSYTVDGLTVSVTW